MNCFQPYYHQRIYTVRVRPKDTRAPWEPWLGLFYEDDGRGPDDAVRHFLKHFDREHYRGRFEFALFCAVEKRRYDRKDYRTEKKRENTRRWCFMAFV